VQLLAGLAGNQDSSFSAQYQRFPISPAHKYATASNKDASEQPVRAETLFVCRQRIPVHLEMFVCRSQRESTRDTPIKAHTSHSHRRTPLHRRIWPVAHPPPTALEPGRKGGWPWCYACKSTKGRTNLCQTRKNSSPQCPVEVGDDATANAHNKLFSPPPVRVLSWSRVSGFQPLEHRCDTLPRLSFISSSLLLFNCNLTKLASFKDTDTVVLQLETRCREARNGPNYTFQYACCLYVISGQVIFVCFFAEKHRPVCSV
jgi:hypothetical protein